MNQPVLKAKLLLSLLLVNTSIVASADILPEAEFKTKFALVKKPTTRPMTVAYVPFTHAYYIADGGLAPMGGENEAPISKSEVHAYDENGKYLNSAKPGYDNRSIYYNPNSGKLETITFNISSDVGFFPNTGIFALDLEDDGKIKNSSSDISQFNPAFGDAATMPSYNPETQHYYAKQERSNLVLVVDNKNRSKVAELKLDFEAANVKFDDVSDHFVAYTGVKSNELALLDVDHKAVLIFNDKGNYVGKSELPKTLKLRSQNHYNGLGYTNNMFMVYHEPEGEFGTYYGFQVVK